MSETNQNIDIYLIVGKKVVLVSLFYIISTSDTLGKGLLRGYIGTITKKKIESNYEQVSVSSGIGRTDGPKCEMPLKW